jgi:hypothetical protein
MDPEFSRTELLAEHPLAWLVEVDRRIVDARMLPLELQAEAQRLGLIPNLPLGCQRSSFAVPGPASCTR